MLKKKTKIEEEEPSSLSSLFASLKMRFLFLLADAPFQSPVFLLLLLLFLEIIDTLKRLILHNLCMFVWLR